jgi:hypothetical protein
MDSIKKLSLKIQETITRSSRVKMWPATITGDGSKTGYSKVKFTNGMEMDVLNLRMSSVNGLKVRVGYDPIMPELLQVLGLREEINVGGGGGGNWNYHIPNHHGNHEYPGPDTVWMQGKQFLPLAVMPKSGLTVRVYGTTVKTSTGWSQIAYQDLDLTDHYAETDYLRDTIYVLIELLADGTLHLVDGATPVALSTLRASDIPEPSAADARPIAAVRRSTHNQDEIKSDVRAGQVNDIVDLRWGLLAEGLTDAPADGTTYGRKDNSWVEVASTLIDHDHSAAGAGGTTLQFAKDIFRFGFVVNYAGTQETTIAFDGTNTFTLAPTGTTWSYYRAGIKYTITGSKTVTLAVSPPAARGKYYIYIDATDGTLTASTSGWNLRDTKVPVASIAWNNALTPKFKMSDERHSCAMDRRYHWEHHYSEGSEAIVSPVLSGYSVAPVSPTDTDNTFAIAESSMADEDMYHVLAALADGNGTTAQYMTTYPATGAFDWALSAVPFKYGTYIQYNNAGTMADGQSGKYYNWYFLMTNFDGDGRFEFLPGKAEYANLAAAQAETFQSLTKTNLPLDEYIACYQITYYANSSYATKGKCRMAAEPKFISISASGASASGSADHEALSGLLGGAPNDHYHLTGTQATDLTDGGASTLHKHSHTNMDDIGTNTHATIDTHLASTANPHGVTAAQAGAVPNDGWIATTLTGTPRTQAYTNDPAAGANITLNMVNTSGFAAGDYVWVSSSAGGEMARIASVVANTSITVDNLTLNHTTTTPLVAAYWFTPSADPTAYLQKGDKLKFTQSTTKYYYVVAVTASVVTLAPTTDYTPSATAISAIYYSNIESPFGFQPWCNYVPSYSASGSMTFTSVTTTAAKYILMNSNTVFVIVNGTGTTGGTAATNLSATPPIASDGVGVNMACTTRDATSGGAALGTGRIATNLLVSKADISNYGLGSGRIMFISGLYTF